MNVVLSWTTFAHFHGPHSKDYYVGTYGATCTMLERSWHVVLFSAGNAVMWLGHFLAA